MTLDRSATSTSVIDVLDRVLDKGVVIDAWVRVSLVGIDLITVEARVVVASISTYMSYAQAINEMAPVSAPTRPEQEGAARRRRFLLPT
jgi:hypothetical protein